MPSGPYQQLDSVTGHRKLRADGKRVLAASGTPCCCSGSACCPDGEPATYTVTFAGVVLKDYCSGNLPGESMVRTGVINGTYTLHKTSPCTWQGTIAITTDMWMFPPTATCSDPPTFTTTTATIELVRTAIPGPTGYFSIRVYSQGSGTYFDYGGGGPFTDTETFLFFGQQTSFDGSVRSDDCVNCKTGLPVITNADVAWSGVQSTGWLGTATLSTP